MVINLMNVLAKNLLQCRVIRLLESMVVLSAIGTLRYAPLLNEHLQAQA